MVWIIILRAVLTALLLIYYVSVLAHVTGAIYLTNRRITFLRCITPFYYWIVDPNKVD